jgi:hypothetical protein
MTTPPVRPSQSPLFVRGLPDNIIPLRNGATVWWSNLKRDGEWILPRIFRVFTCMGNAELDLTQARMGEGVSEIEIRCILGNVEITAPPDVRILCEGEGLLGNFEVTRIGQVPPLPENAPTIRVTGNSYMGSVSIKIIGDIGPGWKDRLIAGWKQLNG